MSAKAFRHLDTTLKLAVEGRTAPITRPQTKNLEVLEEAFKMNTARQAVN
jgi:hypothetical protein